MSTIQTPTAYPLAWPPGWPRTETHFREGGAFKTDVDGALRNLRRQLSLMGATNIVLSSNCALGQDSPKDPGVCAYFEWEKSQMAIPCDRWSRLSHNIQAIALTVEAMRGMERWGAKHMIKAMFTGFKQLPAGDTAPEVREWWKVFGFRDPNEINVTTLQEAYRQQSKKAHPDAGGSQEAFVRLQRAYESGLRAMGAS